MQIFEAAQEYNLTSSHSSDKFWKVVKVSNEWGDGYFVLKTNLGCQLTRVDSSRRDATITLQRGGPRIFKTVDAAVNAVKQIGQDSVEVEL